MSTKKSYTQLKSDLDQEIAWFESGDANIEEAVEHYKKAKMILEEIEKILEKTELEIKKIS